MLPVRSGGAGQVKQGNSTQDLRRFWSREATWALGFAPHQACFTAVPWSSSSAASRWPGDHRPRIKTTGRTGLRPTRARFGLVQASPRE
jgi:hypothetical protein